MYFILTQEYVSSGLKLSSRPYCLMKLEPTIQSLKQKYNQPKKHYASEIHIPKVELFDLIPQKKMTIPKMPANWSTRLLFLLCLLLFYIDFTLCLDLAIQAYRIIRYNQHKLPGFEIVLENPLIFMLGVLSPFYIYLVTVSNKAVVYVQKKVLSKNLKLVNMMHNNLVILQILIVMLVPKSGYKQEHEGTTLMRLASLFDSFSIPLPLLVFKFIHVHFAKLDRGKESVV
ncbi:hypothetical protein HDV06_006242 [Boothiomyces sp. JEL0866]|nr:hypothetical protein HDV06_006242 [Boothiomyces sp. JEL0866]